jgi:hypothetical protein
LNASAKLRAVTLAPVWKRNVCFNSKVYVRPSFETVYRSTTSGTSLVPAAPAASG